MTKEQPQAGQPIEGWENQARAIVNSMSEIKKKNMLKHPHDKFQEFSDKYNISVNYPLAEQIILMAFEEGFRVGEADKAAAIRVREQELLEATAKVEKDAVAQAVRSFAEKMKEAWKSGDWVDKGADEAIDLLLAETLGKDESQPFEPTTWDRLKKAREKAVANNEAQIVIAIDNIRSGVLPKQNKMDRIHELMQEVKDGE